MDNKKKSPENIKNIENKTNNLNKKIEELSYNFLKNYTQKKDIISKLMSFETSKWLDIFKKQIEWLEKKWEINKNISIEKLFLSVKKAQTEILKITKNNIEKFKKELNTKEKNKYNFSKNDITNLLNKNLKNKILNPNNIYENILSASFWILNSWYKVILSWKILTIDLIKLITFQVPLKQLKEQIKKV